MRLSHGLASAMSFALALGTSVFAQTNIAVDSPSIQSQANLANGVVTQLEGLTSFRNTTSGTRAITTGDTFQGAVLGQSIAGAAHVTNTGRVTTFTYDLLGTTVGTLAGSNATVNEVESETVTGPNTLRVRVGFLTADSSSMWINGLTIGGSPMDQGRVDVGAAAFTNGLLWDDLPAAVQSVTITNALFADGVLQATSSSLGNLQTLPIMGTAVVWNGVVGSTVDESQMIFDITVPEPGALTLLGLGALAGLARRRR